MNEIIAFQQMFQWLSFQKHFAKSWRFPLSEDDPSINSPGKISVCNELALSALLISASCLKIVKHISRAVRAGERTHVLGKKVNTEYPPCTSTFRGWDREVPINLTRGARRGRKTAELNTGLNVKCAQLLSGHLFHKILLTIERESRMGKMVCRVRGEKRQFHAQKSPWWASWKKKSGVILR